MQPALNLQQHFFAMGDYELPMVNGYGLFLHLSGADHHCAQQLETILTSNILQLDLMTAQQQETFVEMFCWDHEERRFLNNFASSFLALDANVLLDLTLDDLTPQLKTWDLRIETPVLVSLAGVGFLFGRSFIDDLNKLYTKFPCILITKIKTLGLITKKFPETKKAIEQYIIL